MLANLVNGNTCDDGNACTINDVVTDCACAGTIQDSDGDGVCDANDNCPIVTGQIGSSCDDADTNTINDLLNANCQCVGTPIGCNTNPVTLTLNTDANASQITWYVMLTGTNTAVCSGSGLANSSSISVNCCLPNGCYDLVVTDDFGDGIAGGGYVLRDGNGNRIIDNAGNGASFTTLSLSPFGFCVPLSINTLQANSCDLENAALTTVLRAELNPAVTAQFGSSNSTSGYQFWVTNPNGGFTRRILLTHATPGSGSPAGTPAAQKASYFLLSFMNSSAPLIPKGILLNVRVRSQVAGVYSNFGPACRLIIPVPTCATTQLTTTASPVVSCGALGLTVSSTIWANNVPGATGYQFEFSRSGYTRRLLSGTRSTGLNFATLPLQVNFCYQVRVRVSFDNSATYCPFGPYCNITIGTANCSSGMALDGSSDHISTADEARMTLWPNPNDGAVMNISLTEFDAAVSVVSMDVTDVFGKLVSTRTIPVQERYLNTAVNFEQELAPGLYLVNLTVGEHRYTERLVIH
ncbi:MAG: T9SS type A sorting domain-containing protein [Flavobacteriales bacterium]|nr:T9SS type A sorting domain-containing protein [Flavobacteriales bacterium]